MRLWAQVRRRRRRNAVLWGAQARIARRGAVASAKRASSACRPGKAQAGGRCTKGVGGGSPQPVLDPQGPWGAAMTIRAPRRVPRGDARAILADIRAHLWQWRMARFTRERRRLALRVRWRLRWLAEAADAEAYAEGQRALADAVRMARQKCGCCGQVVQRCTRLRRRAQQRSEAR